MLIGQSIVAPNAANVVYYSPWFPRKGNAFFPSVQYLNRSGAVTFTCQMQTKNNEDSDASPASLGSSFSIQMTTLGEVTLGAVPTPLPIVGCLELVRYKMTISGSGADRWVHFRMMAPVWISN